MANPQYMVAGQRGFGTCPSVWSPSWRQHYCTRPRLTSWWAIVAAVAAEAARKAIGGRRLSAAATAAAADMDLSVLDPRSHWNYGSQPFIMSITNIENHNSNALAFRFDASGKGAYG